MKGDTSRSQSGNGGSDRAGLILRALIHAVVLLPILAALLFVPAGRLDWVMGWVLLGVYLVGLTASSLVAILRHPDLARERRQIPESAEAWDRRLINLYNALIYLLVLPIAGL